MSLDFVRISQSGRDQLIRLKRHTGIQNWNVLCRWAFCLSLKDSNPPSLSPIVTDSNIEMTWKTFGGSHEEIYKGLIQVRAVQDGFESYDAALVAHVHRGLSILLAKEMNSIEDIFSS
ncbi:DNA sulfur modification protein DndE [Arthrobacter sp. PAMC25284]|uniref:DNA sulfur modification protein DndE n=1 Tax=Arthrobacter sp. PAMC25284 TaxID=2861279 RepID=UPI001C630912|nr:DNA sulfur modification protein DndE [Arthrobacter sp. PAMC25284]QYF91075.1 DNA sulfur modification protein DndE [Arthrobacter sp. PAMC25284]